MSRLSSTLSLSLVSRLRLAKSLREITFFFFTLSVRGKHNTERVACREIPLPDGNTRGGGARRDDIIHIDERDFSVCPIPPTIADISSGRTGGRARLNCNKNEVGTDSCGPRRRTRVRRSPL